MNDKNYVKQILFLCFLYFLDCMLLEAFPVCLFLMLGRTPLLHYAPYFAPCDVANRVFMWCCDQQSGHSSPLGQSRADKMANLAISRIALLVSSSH